MSCVLNSSSFMNIDMTAFGCDYSLMRTKDGGYNSRVCLRTTNQKIYEIAYRVGYQDVKYFCRVFKEYSGCSAKLYARGDALQK